MAPVVGVPRLVLRLVKTVQNALICQVFFGVVRGFGRNQLSNGKTTGSVCWNSQGISLQGTAVTCPRAKRENEHHILKGALTAEHPTRVIIQYHSTQKKKRYGMVFWSSLEKSRILAFSASRVPTNRCRIWDPRIPVPVPVVIQCNPFLGDHTTHKYGNFREFLL